MSDQEIEIVRELYLANWDEAMTKSVSLCDRNEASSLIKNLIKSKGWRERVVAAKLIGAFSLYESMEELLSTFQHNPEYYTCQTFVEMILHSTFCNKELFLTAMQEQCTEDDYGKYLKSIINETLQGLKA